MPSSLTLEQSKQAKRTGRLAFAWLAACLLMAATLAVLLPHAKINSSVLALLPQENRVLNLSGEEMPKALEDIFLQRLDRQLVWMISPSAPAKETNLAPVEWWHSELNKLDLVKNISDPMGAEAQNAWGRFAYEHRYQMVDANTRTRLMNDEQAQWVLGQVYSAFAGVSGAELNRDTLLLVRGAQMAQLSQQKGSSLTLKQGWLTTKDEEGREWYLLYGELANSSHSLSTNHETVTQLKALEAQLTTQWPDAKVLSRGALFYSEYASAQAQNDIKRLGSVTIIGMLLMIFLVFRSPRPLLLCVLSIGAGALAGTTATLLCFGEVHLLTLVLSMSVVGVSTDYAIYYLTERMVHGREATPFESAKKIAPAQWIALVTTALAYSIILLAPFPGLRQLAVFGTVGLTAAGLTVMYWFPYLVKGLPVRPVPAVAQIMQWLYLWRTKQGLRWGLPVALAIFSVIGISQLKVNDDVAQLQALPQAVLEQDQAITTLTGQSVEQKWFSIYGRSSEEALQRLEAFKPHLQAAQQQGLITTARMLPLNSAAQQEMDWKLLQEKLPNIVAGLEEAGLPVGEAERFNALDFTPLTVEQWSEGPLAQGWKLLWASLEDGRSAILIPVTISAEADSQAFKALANQVEGVFWEDRKESYTELFHHYRSMLGWLLLGAVGLLALSYLVRLGFKNGLISIVPSLLSITVSLAVLALLGRPLNLFALLALILVLGIGVNYTLFFSNPRGTPTTSMSATVLAFFTTQITLGMLVFSSTHAISSFGLVLSSGIFIAFLLSPLALQPRRRRKKGETKG